MAVSHQGGQESGGCSVHEAGGFFSLHLMLKAWRIRAALLVVSPEWNPREGGSNIDEGRSQPHHR